MIKENDHFEQFAVPWRTDQPDFPRIKDMGIISVSDYEACNAIALFLQQHEIIPFFVDEDLNIAKVELLEVDCFARFIDMQTLHQLTDYLKKHLLSDEVDEFESPYIVVGKEVSIPFKHPLLVAMRDISTEWLENLIAEVKKTNVREKARWDAS
jgi:hypothetical protein